MFSLLRALDERCLSLTVDPISMNLAEIFEEYEQLGEIRGDMEAGDSDGEYRDGSDSEPEEERPPPPRKRMRKDVSSRNTAVQVIVSYSDAETLHITMYGVNLWFKC